MNRDALAFLRILPVGAADIGADVTREDLREAGAGDWSIAGGMIRDDVGSVFPGRAAEIPEEDYDVPLPMASAPEAPVKGAIQVIFRRVG